MNNEYCLGDKCVIYIPARDKYCVVWKDTKRILKTSISTDDFFKAKAQLISIERRKWK